MSLMTRAVTAFAVLSLAAIPVAALTIKNTSGNDITVGVHNGTDQAVYTVPAGGSVEVKEDCSSDCAVTGPWGYSRLVAQNATIETDGTPLVTATADAPDAPAPQALVPQNPVSEPLPAAAPAAEAAAASPPVAAEPAPVAPRKRVAKPRRPSKQASKQAKKKSGPAAGSWQMLLQGPGKK